MDDDHAIVLNPHIGSLSAASLQWIVLPDFGHNPRFMPAGWLGVDLETRLTGLNPFRMHLFVLILHTLNCVILACVLRRFLVRLGFQSSFASIFAPLAGAAFYALHPMRAETLGWVSLSFWHQAVFFALLWSWVRLAPAHHPIAEAAAYLACLLSFPAFLGLAPAAAAVDWIRDGWLPALRRNAFLIALAASCGAGTLYAVKSTSLGEVRPPFPILSQAVQVIAVEGHILIKSLVPTGLSPFAKPLHDLVRADPSEVAGCFLFVGVWLMSLIPRFRFLLPWMAAYSLLVAPFAWTSNWKDPDIGNRYATACHLLLAAATAYGMARLQRFRGPALAATALIIVSFFLLGLSQIRIWENDITLEAAIERSAPAGDNVYLQSIAVARSETAVCRYLLGDFKGALEDIGASLRTDPADSRFVMIRDKIAGMQAMRGAQHQKDGTDLPVPRVMEHWTIAAAALNAGDDVRAQIHLEEIKRLDPHYFARITSN